MKQFAYLFVVLISLSGCKSGLMLQQHHKELSRLASGTVSPEDAFRGLAIEMNAVFDNVLAQPTPGKRVNFLRKFSKQNDTEIKMIFDNLNTWKDELRPIEKIQVTTRLIREPAVQKLVGQLPEILSLINENDKELGKMRQLLLLYRIRQWIS